MAELQISEPYSPLEKFSLQAWEPFGLKVELKREDLSHPFISGNKWRKLKYPLIEAARLDKTKLLTFGGAWSNHILATAAAGAKYGFKTTGIIRGEPITNPVLNLAKLFGMKLHFCSREAYKNKEQLAIQYQGEDVYLIPEGGDCLAGEMGAGEVLQQLPNNIHLCCSVGTGSTFSGLLHAAANQQRTVHLHGFAVLKGADYLLPRFESANHTDFSFHTDSHFGGYAKTKPELIDFIAQVASQTGVLVDQVYEGKMLLRLHKLITEGYFSPGTHLVILHNGGLSGLLGLNKN